MSELPDLDALVRDVVATGQAATAASEAHSAARRAFVAGLAAHGLSIRDVLYVDPDPKGKAEAQRLKDLAIAGRAAGQGLTEGNKAK